MFAVFDLFGKVDAGRIYMVYLDSESKEHWKPSIIIGVNAIKLSPAIVQESNEVNRQEKSRGGDASFETTLLSVKDKSNF